MDNTWAAISVDNISLHFNLEELQLTIPSTLLNSKKNIAAYISGNANLKNQIFDIDIDMKKFKFDSVELVKPYSMLKLKYDKSFSIHTNKVTN